jgi:uncharacterized protein YcfL
MRKFLTLFLFLIILASCEKPYVKALREQHEAVLFENQKLRTQHRVDSLSILILKDSVKFATPEMQ